MAAPAIIIGGGGTGGHVIPALAVCGQLKALKPDLSIIYTGARGSLEERLAKGEGYRFRPVWISALRGRALLGNLLFPLKCLVSLLQARWYLLRHSARMVLATGGFSSWPIGMAARLGGVPYALQEANAKPGLVIRLLSNRAVRVYVGYAALEHQMKTKPGAFRFTGSPTSLTPEALSTVTQSEARKSLGLNPDRPTIFVTGGSGGALSINRAVNEIQDTLHERGYNLIWQYGAHWDGATDVAAGGGGWLMMERFLDRQRMLLAYRAADLAITRSGALTLTELALAGLPAILVPYPFAADNHQESNAREFEVAGAARLILDRDLSGRKILDYVNEIMDSEKLNKMSTAMKTLAKPNAARVIAEDILSLMNQ